MFHQTPKNENIDGYRGYCLICVKTSMNECLPVVDDKREIFPVQSNFQKPEEEKFIRRSGIKYKKKTIIFKAYLKRTNL